MNKIHLCVLPLALLLVASPGQSAGEPECTIDEKPMPPCLGDPRTPMVTVNVESMQVSPRCVRADTGTTIIFRLTPKAGLVRDTVEIFAKTEDDNWLRGRNDVHKELIIIPVYGDPKSDKEERVDRGSTPHNYIIKTEKECLDPRVVVDN